MNKHLSEIITKLYKNQNKVFLQCGTILVCEDSNCAIFDYLHCLFPPLNYPDLKKIESLLKLELPPEYRHFLLSFNGMNLFKKDILIFGLNKKLIKRDFKDVFQPIDIVMKNLYSLDKDYYKFADYSNGDELFFNKNISDIVYLRKKASSEYLKYFPSFYEWLEHTVMKIKRNDCDLIKR